MIRQLLESKPLKKLTSGLALYYSIMIIMLVYLIFDYIIEKSLDALDNDN